MNPDYDLVFLMRFLLFLFWLFPIMTYCYDSPIAWEYRTD